MPRKRPRQSPRVALILRSFSAPLAAIDYMYVPARAVIKRYAQYTSEISFG